MYQSNILVQNQGYFNSFSKNNILTPFRPLTAISTFFQTFWQTPFPWWQGNVFGKLTCKNITMSNTLQYFWVAFPLQCVTFKNRRFIFRISRMCSARFWDPASLLGSQWASDQINKLQNGKHQVSEAFFSSVAKSCPWSTKITDTKKHHQSIQRYHNKSLSSESYISMRHSIIN